MIFPRQEVNIFKHILYCICICIGAKMALGVALNLNVNRLADCDHLISTSLHRRSLQATHAERHSWHRETSFVIQMNGSKKRREGDLKGWSAGLVTAVGSWGKPVPRGHGSEQKRTLTFLGGIHTDI